MSKPGAIIAGATFSSLGVARNLGQHGIPVFVIDCEIGIAQFSKYTQSSFRCPSESDEVRLVEFILSLANIKGIAGSVLFASSDEQVRIFSQYRSTLAEKYIVSLPEWEITRYLYDKRLTCVLAKQLEIPIPETLTIKCIEEISQLDLNYPLVIKPAITPHLVSKTKKKGYRANNPDELRSYYQQVSRIMDSEEILIQEFIPGGVQNLYSYFGYFREGKPLSGYSARRLRQHPMELGKASTYAVSINLPELEVMATKLLSGIGYTGIAEVEFMYDPKHSRFELLEVNPRIWGWHTLAIHAGNDLPYIAYADMTKEPFNVGAYTEGARWMHLVTDLPTAALDLFQGRMKIGDYIRSVSGCKDAVFSLDDPLPFVMELLMIPYLIIKKGF